MFVKITTSGPRQYVKLVESYRDTVGVSRQRVIATLGRIEAVRTGGADSLLNGLLRAAGRPTLEEGTGEVTFAPALSVGDTWLLTALWQELGVTDAFRRLLRNRRQFDAEKLLRVMVFNLNSSVGPELQLMKASNGKAFRPILATAPQFHLGAEESSKKSFYHSQLAADPCLNRGI